MRWILRVLGGLLLLVLVVVGGLTAVYFANREPIPDLARADHADRAVALAPAELIEKARTRLLKMREEQSFPSVSIAVASGGNIVWAEADGYADLAAKRLATTRTQYSIGSTSKPLSAALIVRLADQGVIDLDKDIRTYVPSFPQRPYVVTARELLSHQGGVRHYGLNLTPPLFSESVSQIQYNSATASIAIFANDPLLFEPDTDFTYSSFGYTLLSAAVEGATRSHFLEVMQREIFTPLGMTASGPDDRLQANPDRATEYQNFARDGYVVPAPYSNLSMKWAGGGFRATPSDLARFGIALLDGKIVSPQSRDMMFTPRTLRNGKVNAQHYGLGFRMVEWPDKTRPDKPFRAAHHGGVAVGTRTLLIVMPSDNVVVAFTGNVVSFDFGVFDTISDIAIMFAEEARRAADARTTGAAATVPAQ